MTPELEREGWQARTAHERRAALKRARPLGAARTILVRAACPATKGSDFAATDARSESTHPSEMSFHVRAIAWLFGLPARGRASH